MDILRLTRRADFVRAAERGRKFVVSSFILQHVRQPEPQETPHAARLGFTATKKLGSAVIRNRVKRRLREAARQVFPEAAKPGHDYVLIGRGKSLDCPFEDLTRDMRFALSTLASSKKHT